MCLAPQAHGFNRDNSIACVAICRDEICDPFELEVIARFGPTFGMRGLGGLISCGNTGFGAAHAHSPVIEGKRRYIYFVAPHIAIDESGNVRLVTRRLHQCVQAHDCGVSAQLREDSVRDLCTDCLGTDVDTRVHDSNSSHVRTESVEACVQELAFAP